MGLVQDAEQKVAVWVFKEELPVAMRAGASALVGLLASGKVVPVLASCGVTIDPQRLASKIVAFGTAAAVTFAVHLGSSWTSKKAFSLASGPQDPTPPTPAPSTPQGGQSPQPAAPSLDLLADKYPPLVPSGPASTAKTGTGDASQPPLPGAAPLSAPPNEQGGPNVSVTRP